MYAKIPRNLALVGATLILAACGGGSGRLGLVSTAEEVKFGAQAHEELLKEAAYSDCKACASQEVAPGVSITQYVTTLGNEMAQRGNPDRGAQHEQIQNWRFTVLQSDEVNAFAIPGGYLYVTTALLAMVESKAELAGILGHEVGHVTLYHGVQRLEQWMLVSGIAGLIFGNDSEIAEQAAAFVGQIDSLVSSQDDELDSDQKGVEYSYAAGYNPLDMNLFFEAIRGSGTDPISQVLSSHPAPDTRIARVNQRAGQLGITQGSPNLVKDDTNIPFSAVRSAIAALPTGGGGMVASAGWHSLPPRLKHVVHACRFDPETRQMVHNHE